MNSSKPLSELISQPQQKWPQDKCGSGPEIRLAIRTHNFLGLVRLFIPPSGKECHLYVDERSVWVQLELHDNRVEDVLNCCILNCLVSWGGMWGEVEGGRRGRERERGEGEGMEERWREGGEGGREEGREERE